jgi:hypothetical protein
MHWAPTTGCVIPDDVDLLKCPVPNHVELKDLKLFSSVVVVEVVEEERGYVD